MKKRFSLLLLSMTFLFGCGGNKKTSENSSISISSSVSEEYSSNRTSENTSSIKSSSVESSNDKTSSSDFSSENTSLLESSTPSESLSSSSECLSSSNESSSSSINNSSLNTSISSSEDLSSIESIDNSSESSSIGGETKLDIECPNYIKWQKGKYFNPLDHVRVIGQDGINYKDYLIVEGHVNYGVEGEYLIKYKLKLDDSETLTKETQVSITNSVTTKVNSISKKINLENSSSGSFATDSSSVKTIKPEFVADNLKNKPIPTNTWWSPLTAYNYGGGAGIYTNPIKSSFSSKGVEITNPGKGFLQYFATGTQAQFSVYYQDLMFNSSNLSESYKTQVISYSDNGVQVSMKESLSSSTDEIVVTYSQGSPYVFLEVNDKNSMYFNIDTRGVDNYSFFDLSGKEINASRYVGEALIVKMNKRHIGYECLPPDAVKDPFYEDRYFLINVSKNTVFNFSNKNSAGGFNDFCSLKLGNDNLISVCPIQNISEANFYHKYSYSVPLSSNSSFDVNRENSIVTSFFRNNIMCTNLEFLNNGLVGLLPHQYKKSNATTSKYGIDTIRGKMKMLEGNYFSTQLKFEGVLPTFTLPTDLTFSKVEMNEYLDSLLSIVNDSKDGSLYNSKVPYWNGKILNSLSQAVIQSDQVGNMEMKNIFINKIENLLIDWFNFESSDDSRFLNYDTNWGSMYYSNDEFGTASTLSDHHFTHGYLIYASAICSMYDNSFYESYKNIIELLLKDYMNYSREDENFPYLRCFDSYAGHSWASGISIFSEGNNQESSGEALNSWVAGYLFGLVSGNQELVDTAIYGYTNELYSIKQYWFNYDKDIFSTKYSLTASVAGIVWGGKYDYATWFGADPTFIYGIHWLPTGEYLTGYALGESEKNTLSEIYSNYLKVKKNNINTWYSNMWTIEAIVNSQNAIDKFDSNKILSDDYPNELTNCYYSIHALETYGSHTDQATVSINSNVACSVYYKDGSYKAMCYNPSNNNQQIQIKIGGIIKTLEVPSKTFDVYTI